MRICRHHYPIIQLLHLGAAVSFDEPRALIQSIVRLHIGSLLNLILVCNYIYFCCPVDMTSSHNSCSMCDNFLSHFHRSIIRVLGVDLPVWLPSQTKILPTPDDLMELHRTRRTYLPYHLHYKENHSLHRNFRAFTGKFRLPEMAHFLKLYMLVARHREGMESSSSHACYNGKELWEIGQCRLFPSAVPRV